MAGEPPSRDYRASDADREAAAERLRIASVEGRIDSEELEQRLADAYAARTVAELDRLVGDLFPPPPPPPPVPYGGPYQPAPYQPAPYLAPLAPTNPLALASLIGGVMWLGWLGSVLAVIFGHIALGQIARSGEQGRGLAIVGLVFGYIGVGTLALIVVASVLR